MRAVDQGLWVCRECHKLNKPANSCSRCGAALYPPCSQEHIEELGATGCRRYLLCSGKPFAHHDGELSWQGRTVNHHLWHH